MVKSVENSEVNIQKLSNLIRREADKFYKNQTSRGKSPILLEDAQVKMENFLWKVIKLIKKEDNLFQTSENETTRELQLKIISYFKEHNIIFTISPIQVQRDLFFINASMFEITNTELFNLSQFKFSHEGLTLPQVDENISINEAKIIIPDVRSSKYIRSRMIFDGMTISNPETGKEDVLLFPTKFVMVGHKDSLADEYRESVKMHEAAQAYFNRLIPNFLLMKNLNSFMKKSDSNFKDTILIEVQEAFGEWASLKYSYGESFLHEIKRLIKSRELQYAFSKSIALDSISLYRREKDCNNLNQLDLSDLKDLQKIIVENFEANLVICVNSVLKKLPKQQSTSISRSVKEITKS